MTYQECLQSTFFDWQSWAIVLAGLLGSLALAKYGKKGLAIATVLIGLLAGVVWAYLYYELNCVELIRP